MSIISGKLTKRLLKSNVRWLNTAQNRRNVKRLSTASQKHGVIFAGRKSMNKSSSVI